MAGLSSDQWNSNDVHEYLSGILSITDLGQKIWDNYTVPLFIMGYSEGEFFQRLVDRDRELYDFLDTICILSTRGLLRSYYANPEYSS